MCVCEFVNDFTREQESDREQTGGVWLGQHRKEGLPWRVYGSTMCLRE